ncbi:MAG: Uma2 family endonuclease [Thermosynechococcaceae cyanobacterium MS004]|nr:Uma2 family endonuclease [Thermosynechococcaceae cyanobacterium MS004]
MVNTLPAQTVTDEPDGWVAPPTDLIFDDGVPLETNQHRVAMNVLIRSYQQYRAGQTDYYVGGNMFVYYSSAQVKNRDFRGPDFFVVLDVEGTHSRQGWVVWDEGGRYPDVIIELMSPSTAKVDLGFKKQLYDKTFKTQDYFVYNPFDANSLQGWHRNSAYQEITPNERGWLWCETLGLWLGTWTGTIDRETESWLRFYDTEGKIVPLPEEAAQQRADAAQQRADRLAARLRELGEDPDQI